MADEQRASWERETQAVERASTRERNHRPHDNTRVVSPIDIDAPPPSDGGDAWVCCGALAISNAFTWRVAASYGVYIPHYLANDYFPGATPLDVALVGGLEFGVALISSPLCTLLTRELGRLVVMSTGCAMFAGGFVAASFASETWQLYVSQGVLVGLGLGGILIPSIQVLPQWFSKRRSLAGGLARGGSGLGGLAFSLGTNAMIEQIGLGWALRITGILCLVGNLTATLLVNAVLIFAVWLPGESYGVLIFFAIVAGAFIGTFWMTIAPPCAEVAGRAEVPSFLSLQWLTTVLPTTFAEVIALYLGRPSIYICRIFYLYTQIFAGGMYLLASLFLFELWRVKRRSRTSPCT